MQCIQVNESAKASSHGTHDIVQVNEGIQSWNTVKAYIVQSIQDMQSIQWRQWIKACAVYIISSEYINTLYKWKQSESEAKKK